MTKLDIDNTKFYKIVPSNNGVRLYEDVKVSDKNVHNNIYEQFTQYKKKTYLTTNLTEKFLDEKKHRSEYDRMMMKNYHD